MAEVLSRFGGVAGQVLLRALHRSTWVSGILLTGVLVLTVRGLDSIGRPDLFPVAAMPLLMLGLAYHGVRAAAANDSSFDPTVSRTLVVAARAALATSVWLAPWMFWGSSLERNPAMFESIGVPSVFAAGLYLCGCLVATPAILIAAVGSTGWFDMLSPMYWSRKSRVRGSDLMTVYTIQTGAAAIAVVSMGLIVAGTTRINATAGIATAVLAACVVLGYWVSLTGRLCGSIHATPEDNEVAAEQSRLNAGPALASSASTTQPDTDRVARPSVAVPDGSDIEAPTSASTSESLETEKPRREDAVTPAKPVEFDVPKLSKNVRKTPLLDAETRTAEAMKRFRLDPSHTLSKLAELNQNFAPCAHVLQALAICLHRTGHSDQALAAARQAFSLCFERGYFSLAAALFYEFRGQLQKLDLKKDQVLEIAKLLHKSDELAVAAKAYSLVIHTDPGEYLAVKGLLDVADGILDEKKKPAAALKVYMFLLDNCNDPTLTEIVHDGVRRCKEAEETGAKATSTRG